MAPNPAQLLAGARQAIDLMRAHGATIGYVRVGFADASEIGGSFGSTDLYEQPGRAASTRSC